MTYDTTFGHDINLNPGRVTPWMAHALGVEKLYLHMATACPMRLLLYPSPPELLSKLMTVPHIACGLIDG